MKVAASSVIEVSHERESVFRAATLAENLPKIFRGAGPVAAIENVTLTGGDAMEKGVVRKLRMADGSTLDEEIIEYEPPLKFAYRVSGLRPPLSLLVGSMHGRWTFTPYGEGTRIAWVYTVELRSILLLPLGLPLIKLFMQRAMDDCLRRFKALIEA